MPIRLQGFDEFREENNQYKRKDQENKIYSDSSGGYNPSFTAKKYSNDSDGFVESAIIGSYTNSTFVGAVLGGNLGGAMFGDWLNDDDD